MNFINHSNLKGEHALLSPSNYHWLNYDESKFKEYFTNIKAKERGTDLHALAEEHIRLGVRGSKSKNTLDMYINDAIGYRMQPEVVLYYSDICFGTADAISFKDNMLRIHDLKTGKTKPSISQLEIYAALFCLEYHINPNDINMELRLYYQDDIIKHEPNPSDISDIMDKIVESSKLYFEIERGE